MGRCRRPYCPTPRQRMLIAKAGLDPAEWSVRWESARYLSLVERGYEQRRYARIDLDTMETKMR